MAQLLKVNGVDVSHLVSYEITRNTLLGPNSGRDTTGKNHIDLIGIFHSVKVTMGESNKATMQALLAELEKYIVTVSYYDPLTGVLHENVSMYAPDYTVSLKKYIKNPKYNQFQFELIANQKTR